MDSTMNAKGENNGRIKGWSTLLGSQHFGVKGRARAQGWRLGRMKNNQLLTRTYTDQTKNWLVHSWSTFGARITHGQTWTHKTHHNPGLGEAITFPPYNIIYAWPWG
jgi:hypothetical protein